MVAVGGVGGGGGGGALSGGSVGVVVLAVVNVSRRKVGTLMGTRVLQANAFLD